MRKRIVISSNYAWTILNFRRNLIQKLLNDGYEVVLVTQFDGYEDALKQQKVHLHNLSISRKGLNPFSDFWTFVNYCYVFARHKPSTAIFFTIKPVIYGSLAARILDIPSIAMITGLGTVFIRKNFVTKVVQLLYRLSLGKISSVIFQNQDDRRAFIDNSLVDSRVARLSPGSGIDLKHFKYEPYPETSEVIFLMIARMLFDKGVAEFVEAARMVAGNHQNVRFQLLGPLGVENRTAVSAGQMKTWVSEGFVEYLGETESVTPFIQEASCVVLPSYREGTSRVLLEACALGRPVIATEVPGCREIVENGVSGLLCQPRDARGLHDQMIKILIMDWRQRRDMGKAGRQKVEKEFDEKIVLSIFSEEISKAHSQQNDAGFSL